MTSDHIRQRLAEPVWNWHVLNRHPDELVAVLEQTVRDLIADELEAAAEEIGAYRDMPVTYLQDCASAVRAGTGETT